MKINAIMTIEIIPGTGISQACAMEISIATKLECGIKFTFNEVELLAKPYQGFIELVNEYFYVSEST